MLSKLHQDSTSSGGAQEAEQILLVGVSVGITCCLLCEALADE